MPAKRLRGPALWLVLIWMAIGQAVPACAFDHGDYLMTMPVEGGEPKRLIAEPDRRCGSPRWSPDGEWIAYDTAPYDKRASRDVCRVMVVKADGTGRREIAPGGMPTWSPDGTQLAWHTYDGGGPVQVGRFDGTAIETVVDHWGNPVWLRDGRGIVTIDRGGLSLYDFVSGREQTLLAPPTVIQYGYSVSPEGGRVSYRIDDPIWSVSNGGERTAYTAVSKLVVASFDPVIDPIDRVVGGKVEYSSWSPDGKRLVIAWKRPGSKRFQLYTLTADGDDDPQPVPGQGQAFSNMQPDWSPDGKGLVFRRYVNVEAAPDPKPEYSTEAIDGLNGGSINLE